ncbi:MAG: PSD1 and planctomycete cytochrome C domain-containing protein, partial [Planctomycetota bacterium]|nr:PSD1 and planctomycete cytochrome C domain-containing protein [Planctomycetota bacterium]
PKNKFDGTLLKLLACAVTCSLSLTGTTAAEDAAALDFFEKKIRPVLVENCYECHSAQALAAKKLKGGLQLDTRAGIREGGESGPAVVPLKLDASELLAAIRHETVKMPPKGKLPDSVIADFETWIRSGAADPREGDVASLTQEIDIKAGRRFWSIRPLIVPDIPEERGQWARTGVDQFVIEKLKASGLTPVADAEASLLARRLYVDLTGLPPSPAEVDSFVTSAAKNRSAAVETLVDQLLDSPHFGERWGRHWLDVARYAESNGGTNDRLWPDAWRFRDYVIDSFNRDKPFDQFLREQIAGDLMPSDSDTGRWERLVASGFLAMGSKANNATRMEIIGEQLDVMGRAMLGLSIGCARCHDHKYDPVPTRDFYSLAGIMQNTGILDGKPFASRDPKLPKPELQKVKEFERAVAAATRGVTQGNDRLEELAGQQNMRRRPGESWEDVLSKFSDAGRVSKAEETLKQLRQAESDLEKLKQSGPLDVPLAVAVIDRAAKGRTWLNARIHIRGSDSNLGEEVPRGVLQVLLSADESSPGIGEQQSGRRQLAEVVSRHPLAARVIVNRIWHHLFGRGIVRTVDNFGALGEAPTHPELLEWLAAKFVEDGWSVKQTIRRVVLSRTWQLSADDNDTALASDPDNILLWRHSPRRLDAEALRDAILSASGAINLERPSRFDNAAAAAEMTNPSVADRSMVRAVYLPVARGHVTDLLAAFNFAPSDLVVGRRETPSVPTQALFMLNSRMVTDQSQIMARRLIGEVGDAEGRINLAYQLVFCRSPESEERTSAVEFVNQLQISESETADEQDAWAALCQALFASSEFRFLR